MLVELTIIPIGTGSHLSSQLADIVAIIDHCGLPYLLTPTGTCIEGEWEEVMPVVKRCHDEARRSSTHIQTFISIEDDQNDKSKLHGNVTALEKRLGHLLQRSH